MREFPPCNVLSTSITGWRSGSPGGVGAIGLLLPAGHGASFKTTGLVYFLAGCGPTLAGVLMTAWFGGAAAVRRLLGAAVPSRASVAWYPAILLGYPALAFAVDRVLPNQSSRPPVPWSSVAFLLAAALLTDTGPLGEEFGWRGFALPRLLTRRTPLASGFILGVIWALWHLPTFFIASLPQSHLSIPWFFVAIIALSVAQTGLYVVSGGRLDLMILVHLVANFWASYLSAEARATAHLVLALVAIPAARMWTRVARHDTLGQLLQPTTRASSVPNEFQPPLDPND